MSKNPQPIIIVQGGQWGSEAKGMVTAALCSKRNVQFCVRTGAVNAGHTVIYHGEEFKMQQLPCGFVNPDTELVIGAGAMIYPSILVAEIKLLQDKVDRNILERLMIDFRCGIHLPRHGSRSTAADRHYKIGATGKGCSEAIVEKISGRGGTGQLFQQWLDESADQEFLAAGLSASDVQLLRGITYADTEAELNAAYDEGHLILLEGTQGTLLDLHLGPYPYTTHKQTLAGQWALECGLSPSLEYEVVLVMRTYPIRVAGNSGPMPQELSWLELADTINSKQADKGIPARITDKSLLAFEEAVQKAAATFGVNDTNIETWDTAMRSKYQSYVSELHKTALKLLPADVVADLCHLFEMTTVTRKLRRIARLDINLARDAVRQNRPAYIVLTFLNYEFPQYWGETHADVVMGDRLVRDFVTYYQDVLKVPVKFITTGPETKHFLDTKHGKLAAEVKSASTTTYGQLATGEVK